MAKSAAYSEEVLRLIFLGTTITGLADNAASSPNTDLWVSLHTGAPGENGANETTYTGYARVAVARSGSGWTVSGAQVSNASAVTFGAITGGSGTITHAAIRTASTGSSRPLYSATTPNIEIEVGTPLRFDAGDLKITEA